MTNRDLAAVRVRLEEAIANLPYVPKSVEEVWEQYLEISISILDSESEQFTPGLLQEYLESLLYERRLLLGLEPLPVTPDE